VEINFAESAMKFLNEFVITVLLLCKRLRKRKGRKNDE
jgi:hypothetical protein